MNNTFINSQQFNYNDPTTSGSNAAVYYYIFYVSPISIRFTSKITNTTDILTVLTGTYANSSMSTNTTSGDYPMVLSTQANTNYYSSEQQLALTSGGSSSPSPMSTSQNPSGGNANNNNGSSSSSSLNSNFFAQLAIQISSILNVSDVEIDLQRIYWESISLYDYQQLINEMLTYHYQHSTDKLFSNLVLSSSVLGNPKGVLRSISQSARNVVNIPRARRNKNKLHASTHLVISSAKLVGTTVGGVFTIASDVTSTLSKGLNKVIINDQHHQQKRNLILKEQPKNVLSGMKQGALSVGNGLFGAVTGLVTQPIHGARKDGVKGGVTGFLSAVVNVPTKIAVGSLDGISSVVTGVANTLTTRVETPPLPYRLSLIVSPLVVTFSAEQFRRHLTTRQQQNIIIANKANMLQCQMNQLYVNKSDYESQTPVTDKPSNVKTPPQPTVKKNTSTTITSTPSALVPTNNPNTTNNHTITSSSSRTQIPLTDRPPLPPPSSSSTRPPPVVTPPKPAEKKSTFPRFSLFKKSGDGK